eukprot:4434412-Alexandrium_andersonii.AAC.1
MASCRIVLPGPARSCRIVCRHLLVSVVQLQAVRARLKQSKTTQDSPKRNFPDTLGPLAVKPSTGKRSDGGLRC